MCFTCSMKCRRSWMSNNVFGSSPNQKYVIVVEHDRFGLRAACIRVSACSSPSCGCIGSLVLVCVAVHGRKEDNNGHSNTKSPTEPMDEVVVGLCKRLLKLQNNETHLLSLAKRVSFRVLGGCLSLYG